MNGLRPVLIFLFSYLAGFLVIQGEISQACHNDVVNAFIFVAGHGILLVTSAVSLIHAFRHPHDKIEPSPIVSNSKTVETTTQQVFTPNFSQDLGTPPPTT